MYLRMFVRRYVQNKIEIFFWKKSRVFIKQNMSDNKISEMQVVCGGGGVSAPAKKVKPVRVTKSNKIAKLKETIRNGDKECIKMQALFNDNMLRMSDKERKIRKLKEKLKQEVSEYKNTKWETQNIYEKINKWSLRLTVNNIRRDIGKKADLQDNIQILEMRDSIDKSNREFAVVAKANQKRMSKNTILADISKLPVEIVDNIREYIPIEIRNEMIEQMYNPVRKLVPKLDRIALNILTKRIYLDPAFFATLSPEKVEQNTQGQPSFQPDWRFDTKTNMRVRFLNAIVETKRSHPELLYKLFSTLAILIKPDRNYNSVYRVE